MDTLTILGNGDSMGVPRVYCSCLVCEEARSSGSNRRLRSAVKLQVGEAELWIDCGPDWKEQMEGEGQRVMPAALLTHAHFDHIGGLPEWADACRWTKQTGTVYAPDEVLVTIRERYPWLERQLDYRQADEGVSFGDWRITCCKVCHGKNGFSYAYRFDKADYAFAYCPDAINLGNREKAFLANLDLLILGTSYYKEEFDYHTRSVYDMVEACQLLEEIQPRRTLLTHMSHGIDVRTSYPLPPQVALSARGMQITLQREL